LRVRGDYEPDEPDEPDEPEPDDDDDPVDPPEVLPLSADVDELASLELVLELEPLFLPVSPEDFLA
jgi:hypothetical protein